MRKSAMISQVFFMLVLVVFVSVASAQDMTTAITYQGKLSDAGAPAQGSYDFTFALYYAPDAPTTKHYNKLESVAVEGGLFTVDLDFGEYVFSDGDDLWLGVFVRPGELADPNAYTELLPRQKVTATPYAIYAKKAGEVAYGSSVTGDGTANYLAKFTNTYTLGDSLIYETGSNIGIGTTSPSYPLHVVSPSGIGNVMRIESDNGNSTIFRIANTSAGGREWTLQTSGASGPGGVGAFVIRDNTAIENRILVDNSGNVGIGTTSPAHKLHIMDNPNASLKIDAQGTGASISQIMLQSVDAGHGELIKYNTGRLALRNAANADLQLGTYNGGSLTFSIGGNDVVKIIDNGKMGIGTTSPDSELHVNGAIRMGSGSRDFEIQEVSALDPAGWSSYIDYDGIGIGSIDGNNRQMLMLTDGANDQNILTMTTSQNNGSTWEADFVMQQDGKVGIGTDSPDYKLDVGGPVNLNKGGVGSALRVNDAEALWYDGTYFSWGYGGTKNYFADPVGIGTSDPGYWELYVVGDACKTEGGTSWNVISDIRLKDIHGPYEYGLEQIRQITPVRFNYKEDNQLSLSSDHQQIGVVAQEVQKVIPDAISKTDQGYLSLNMDPVIMAMLNAIKQQQEQIEVLQEKIENLEYQLKTKKR